MADQLTFELEAVTDWLPVSRNIPQDHRTAPDNSGKWYQCFTLDHDEEIAAQAFEERYGYPPAEIFEDSGLLWLGPVK